MVLKTLDILLDFAVEDGDAHVYLPGDDVTGKVRVSLIEPIRLNALELWCVGKAGVCWSSDTDDSEESIQYLESLATPNTEENKLEKVYFTWRTLLWGTETSSSEGSVFTAPPGNHLFPFTFRLPFDIPSTFSGSCGYVQYFIQAVLRKPQAMDDEVFKVFDVMGKYDLNKQPTASDYVKEEKEDTHCCWCCQDGKYHLNITMVQTGFVCGENLSISCDVKNYSSVICCVEMIFKQKIKYGFSSAETRTKEISKKIYKQKHFIQPREEICLSEPLSIEIPLLPPTSLVENLIQPTYKLHISMQPNGCNFDLIQFSQEILIGTVPVRFSSQQMPAAQIVIGQPIHGPICTGEVIPLLPVKGPQSSQVLEGPALATGPHLFHPQGYQVSGSWVVPGPIQGAQSSEPQGYPVPDSLQERALAKELESRQPQGYQEPGFVVGPAPPHELHSYHYQPQVNPMTGSSQGPALAKELESHQPQGYREPGFVVGPAPPHELHSYHYQPQVNPMTGSSQGPEFAAGPPSSQPQGYQVPGSWVGPNPATGAQSSEPQGYWEPGTSQGPALVTGGHSSQPQAYPGSSQEQIELQSYQPQNYQVPGLWVGPAPVHEPCSLQPQAPHGYGTLESGGEDIRPVPSAPPKPDLHPPPSYQECMQNVNKHEKG